MNSLPPFQTLLDRHAGEVLAVLRGAVGHTDAEDCFQDTFLAALRAYPRLESTENLRGWLLRIAQHKAVDHHRARGRRPIPVAEVEAGAEEFNPDLDRAEVWEHVDRLPPKQRAAVSLRFGCDLPHAEIAAALGCSPAAARRSLHEGIKRLRKELA